MKRYRLKQIGDKFYPQRKKFFCWKYYEGESYLDYGAFSLFTGEKDVIYYNDLYFNSFESAYNFLIEKKKIDSVKYYNI